MAEYTVMQTVLKTGTVVKSLPVTGIQFGEVLNSAGTASVGIPLFSPQADPTSLIPGISGLVILRNGEPVWGGVLWTLNANIEAGTLTLNASGYHSYYQGRHFLTGWTTRTTEQAVIIKRFFDWLNSQNGIGTVADGLAPTGRLRSCIWTRYELKNAAEAIEELADNVGGFNFRYVPYWETTTKIAHRFTMASRAGVKSAHTLTHTFNCNVTSVSMDGTSTATVAYAVGADKGNGEKLVGIFQNKPLAARMAERSVISTYSDVKETQTLIGKAQAVINAGSVPVAIPELTLYPGMFEPGDFKPGDLTAVAVDAGYVAIADEYVVTETGTTVDANGTEITKLSLASKEVFQNANPS